jgi:hypothetical protein
MTRHRHHRHRRRPPDDSTATATEAGIGSGTGTGTETGTGTGTGTGTAAGVEFPELDAGVTLLDADGRLVHGLRAPVVDHLLGTGGIGWWVDAGDRARTSVLRARARARAVETAAPSREVARGAD